MTLFKKQAPTKISKQVNNEEPRRHPNKNQRSDSASYAISISDSKPLTDNKNIKNPSMKYVLEEGLFEVDS